MAKQATYFWSGSNHAGEIDGITRNGEHVGVTIERVKGASEAMAAILSLVDKPRIRVIADVARNSSGKPMFFVPQGRALLPNGDAEVRINGQRVTMGFRKIAVNVIKKAGEARNCMAELAAKLFGDNAGARGARHKVALELTRVGWRARRVELDELKNSDARVFVDSGAFSEVKLNRPRKDGSFPFPEAAPFSWVAVKPITHKEWIKRLADMSRIVDALGPRCYPVAPDRVGDQAETLRRLTRYRDTVCQWLDKGARVIVPLQKGELSQTDFDAAVQRVLGRSDYVRGIPSNKAAATPAEIGELASSLPAGTRVHLLGIGPRSRNWGKVIKAIPATCEVSCDSAGIPSLVGRNNGKGGGARILTAIRDQICHELGVPTVEKKRDTPRTTMIKALMLDRFFATA